MKTIHLAPIGGLGNRMRTISSVYNHCRQNGIELIIHWFKEHKKYGFNASFYSLFRPIPTLKIIDCNRLDFFTYNLPFKYNLYIPRIIDLVSGRNSMYNLTSDALSKLTFDKSITIVTGSQQGDLYPLSQLFKPTEKIQKEIDQMSLCFGENVIGCHIRRTDNTISIKAASVEKFETRLDTLFDVDKNVKVFLCTDDTNVKNSLVAKYGDRIITYHSVLDRNSTKGITDAVIELWLLSKTKEIYGSYWSSFSEIAAQMGRVKLTIIK